MHIMLLAFPPSGLLSIILLCIHYSLGWRRLLFSLQKSSTFAIFLTVLPRKKWWCWVCRLAVWPTSCCCDQKTKHFLKWLMPQILLLCLRIIQLYLLQLGRSLFSEAIVAKSPFTCVQRWCVCAMHLIGIKMCSCNTRSIKNWRCNK